MSRDPKDLLKRDVSEEARQRIFRSADALIDEMHGEKAPSLLQRLLSPVGALGLTAVAAAAVVVVLELPKKETVKPELALDPELVRNVEMLLDLETLEHWNPGPAKKAKEEWRKQKT